MTIKQEELEKLVYIYNNLLSIFTNGENTLIMSDCLRSLKQTILQIQNRQEE